MKQPHILALGFFDGVHLGHGRLLRQCRRMADSLGISAGALTFHPHPQALITGSAPGLINTLSDREFLLKRLYGMDSVFCLSFDAAMQNMPAEDFFSLLLRKCGAQGLVCGEDYRFGARGRGNAALLQKLCREAKIPCVVIPQQKLGQTVISSTHVRSLLEAGELAEAARFLGHPHILGGKIVEGQHLGRKLGFPTANIAFPKELAVPKKGVYAAVARFRGKRYLAVTNIGSRPTVGGTGITAESWLPDFTGDLYGEEILLEFHSFLRPEQKFDSLQALTEAVNRDGEIARKALGF